MARPAAERADIDRMLMSSGLSKLTDPSIVPQLGFLLGRVCTSHEQFREFLNRCEPEYRRDMYEAIRPYLQFTPKPLDVYIAELGAIAEARQLPVVSADGTLKPFQAPEIETANAVLKQAIARKHLTVVCVRCTREETFPGLFKQDCLDDARAAGWRYDAQSQSEICPKCPA